jgi:hypothetical protein
MGYDTEGNEMELEKFQSLPVADDLAAEVNFHKSY